MTHAVKFAWLATLLSISLPAQPCAGPLVIGSFDAARGGNFALANGSYTGQLRDAIAHAYPQTRYRAINKLDSNSLVGIDVLVLCSMFDCCVPAHQNISPLSTAEQTALLSFVVGGGSAVIMTDNPGGHFNGAYQSLVAPFGFVHDSGFLQGPHPIDITMPGTARPVSGPLGTVTTFDGQWPGWYSSVPNQAVILGTLRTNNAAVLAYSVAGSFGPNSGEVLFSAESNSLWSEEKGRAIVLNFLSRAMAGRHSNGQTNATNAALLAPGATLSACPGPFGVIATGASVPLDFRGPPSAATFLAFGLSTTSVPTNLGCAGLLDLAQLVLVLPGPILDGAGRGQFVLAIPPGLPVVSPVAAMQGIVAMPTTCQFRMTATWNLLLGL